jgi:hypothetical protein
MLKPKKKIPGPTGPGTLIKGGIIPPERPAGKGGQLHAFYAKYGSDFIHTLYVHSPALEQQFIVLEEQ